MPEDTNIHTSGGGKSFHDQIDELRSLMEENLRYTKTIHEFTPKDRKAKEDEIQRTLKDISDYTKACYALLEKLNKWLFWHKFASFLKFFIIYVPIMAGIVLGIIYLPSFIEKYIQPYLGIIEQAKDINKFIPR